MDIDAILNDLLETVTCVGDIDGVQMNRELAYPIMRAAILAERTRWFDICIGQIDGWPEGAWHGRPSQDYALGRRDGARHILKAGKRVVPVHPGLDRSEQEA